MFTCEVAEPAENAVAIAKTPILFTAISFSILLRITNVLRLRITNVLRIDNGRVRSRFRQLGSSN
jgi:hypothetical protein